MEGAARRTGGWMCIEPLEVTAMVARTAVLIALLVVGMMVLQGCSKPVPKEEPPAAANLAAPEAPGTPTAANEEAAPANGEAAGEAKTETASADGKALYETKCAKCHDLKAASSEPGDQAHWDELVKEMQAKKADWISDDEATQIAEYCAATYPKK
jgi:cytochrome c5